MWFSSGCPAVQQWVRVCLPSQLRSLGPKITWYHWFKPKVCSSCRIVHFFEVTSNDLDEYEGANLFCKAKSNWRNCLPLLVQVEGIANLQESQKQSAAGSSQIANSTIAWRIRTNKQALCTDPGYSSKGNAARFVYRCFKQFTFDAYFSAAVTCNSSGQIRVNQGMICMI